MQADKVRAMLKRYGTVEESESGRWLTCLIRETAKVIEVMIPDRVKATEYRTAGIDKHGMIDYATCRFHGTVAKAIVDCLPVKDVYQRIDGRTVRVTSSHIVWNRRLLRLLTVNVGGAFLETADPTLRALAESALDGGEIYPLWDRAHELGLIH